MNDAMKSELELAEKHTQIKFLNEYFQRAWKEIGRQNRKEFAAFADISPSYAGEILNTNDEGNSKPIQENMLAVLLIMNPNLFKTLFLDFCLDMAGYDPAPEKRKLTPEEELAEYKRIISEHKLTPLFEKIK